MTDGTFSIGRYSAADVVRGYTEGRLESMLNAEEMAQFKAMSQDDIEQMLSAGVADELTDEELEAVAGGWWADVEGKSCNHHSCNETSSPSEPG